MRCRLLWLDQPAEVAQVGARASYFSRLRASGFAVPRAFALGRQHYDCYLQQASGHSLKEGILPRLPHETMVAIKDGMRQLGKNASVRRSPFASDAATHSNPRGGRPERETFVNLAEAAEVY